MKKAILAMVSFAVLISISVQAQICKKSTLFDMRKSETILAKGYVMATINGGSKAFIIGQYEIASVISCSGYDSIPTSFSISEHIAVRLKLPSVVVGSSIDPNGFNSGTITMETEFENFSKNNLLDSRPVPGIETLSYHQLKNGNLVRRNTLILSPAYDTMLQFESDRWAVDHLLPIAPLLISGKIQNTKVRDLSCSLRSLIANLSLIKATGEKLYLTLGLKSLKLCQ
jgi:hypothetical protein